MFTATISGKTFAQGPAFCPVFVAFYTEIIKIVESSITTDQWLSTTNWIEWNDSGARRQLDYYQARDAAYEIGLLVGEGELQEIPEPDIRVIRQVFMNAYNEHMERLAEEIPVQK